MAVERMEVEGLMYVTCEVHSPSAGWDACYRGRGKHATRGPRTSGRSQTTCDSTERGRGQEGHEKGTRSARATALSVRKTPGEDITRGGEGNKKTF